MTRSAANPFLLDENQGMITLYFVTGNAGKFSEAHSLIPDLRQLDIDLPEIQEVDPTAIIREKLAEARRQVEGELLVEDTSLYMECLNGLPGPLIKWFLQEMGVESLAGLAVRLGDDRAEAKTIIGHANSAGQVRFFEGAIVGRVVPPRGAGGFGWDSIFQPMGSDKTFAEMTAPEKRGMSMRAMAIARFLGEESAADRPVHR